MDRFSNLKSFMAYSDIAGADKVSDIMSALVVAGLPVIITGRQSTGKTTLATAITIVAADRNTCRMEATRDVDISTAIKLVRDNYFVVVETHGNKAGKALFGLRNALVSTEGLEEADALRKVIMHFPIIVEVILTRSGIRCINSISELLPNKADTNADDGILQHISSLIQLNLDTMTYEVVGKASSNMQERINSAFNVERFPQYKERQMFLSEIACYETVAEALFVQQ